MYKVEIEHKNNTETFIADEFKYITDGYPDHFTLSVHTVDDHYYRWVGVFLCYVDNDTMVFEMYSIESGTGTAPVRQSIVIERMPTFWKKLSNWFGNVQ